MAAKALVPILPALAALVAHAAPAAACSVSGSYNRPVEERIAGRDDLRRVTGIYRIERIDPQTTYQGTQAIHGRLTTRRGTSFAIVQDYNEIWVDCLVYTLPTADAAGTFYVSRRRRGGGEYQLVDWSGHYIQGMAILRTGD